MTDFIIPLLQALEARIGKVLDWIDLDFWECAFLGMASLFVYVLIRASRDALSRFSFADLLIDGGAASIKKTGALVALLTSTWVIARAAAFGTLSTEMFLVYLGTWSGTYLAAPVMQAYAAKLSQPDAAPAAQPKP